MRKLVYIIIGIFLLLIIFNKPQSSDELRVRVIANSDTTLDQEIKYKVVSNLIETIDDLSISKATKEKLIIDNIDVIRKCVSLVLEENEVLPQGFTVELTKEKFPTKSLNDKVIPGGIYKTLVVKIGQAKGKNWWSLLYPEFFNCSYEDINSGEIEVRSYFWDKFKKIIN